MQEVVMPIAAGADVKMPTVRGLVVRSKWMHRLLTFLMVFGPGLIVMVADNAGAVSTYVQSDSDDRPGVLSRARSGRTVRAPQLTERKL